MRVRGISLIVSLAMCVSLVSVLAPLATHSVEASPCRILTLMPEPGNGSGQPNNLRPITLESGSEIVQFTRPDLIVQKDVIGGFCTVGRMSGTMSGDLQGEMTSDMNSLQFCWSEQQNPDGSTTCQIAGNVLNTMTFDDGSGNRFNAVCINDLGPSSAYLPGGKSYIVSTSGEGTFRNTILIGESIIPQNTPAPLILRWYAGSEISGPYPVTVNQAFTAGIQHTLDPASYWQPCDHDEFIQFSTTNIVVPLDTPASYVTNVSGSGTVAGGLTGNITTMINYLEVPSTTPANRGWSAGTFTYTGSYGTMIHGSVVNDFYGKAYMFATLDETKDGKEYFMEFGPSSDPLKHTMTGSLYVLEQSGAQIETATGTGTATLSASSGTIQNLTAVKPPTSPAPPVSNLVFPDGMFSFNITGVTHGGTATVDIQLPSGIPANAAYWKYDSINGWSQIPYTVVSANEIAITLADDGTNGDLVAGDGVINDPGGLGGPGPSGGAHSAPVFPSIYIGIGAALGAGIVAYALRRRLAAHRTE